MTETQQNRNGSFVLSKPDDWVIAAVSGRAYGYPTVNYAHLGSIDGIS